MSVLDNIRTNLLNRVQEQLFLKPTPNRQIQNLQLEELRRAQEEEQRLREAMSTYGQNLPADQRSGFNTLPLSVQQQIVAAPYTRTPQAIPSNLMTYGMLNQDPTPDDGVITPADQEMIDSDLWKKSKPGKEWTYWEEIQGCPDCPKEKKVITAKKR